MARVRDEDLCRQGDEYEEKRMVCPDPALKQAIDAARLRRAKRAEAARVYP
jgi:hypothetical protein